MAKSSAPPASLFLAIYTLAAGGFSALLILLHASPDFLVMLTAPVILAALWYPRRVYLTVLLSASIMSVVAIFVVRPYPLMALGTMTVVTLTIWGMTEIVYQLNTRRGRTQRALRASEEGYRLLFERNLAGVYRTTLDGRILDCNDAFAHIFGLATRQELLGRQVDDLYLLSPDRAALTAQLLAQGRVANCEISLRRNGQPAWVLESVSLHSDESGNPVLEGSVIDITAHKQIEEALRESERRFREMLEHIQLIAVGLDTDGTITFCNDYMLRLSGWTRAEVIGRDWFDLFRPLEQRNEAKLNFRAAMQNGQVQPHTEGHLYTRTGEPRLIAWNNTVLLDPQGRPIGTTSIGDDITDRRHSEQQLQLQAAALASAANAIAIADSQGRITWVNPAYTRLTGYTSAEAAALNIYTAPHGADRLPEEMIRTVQAGGVWQGEWITCRKDGTRYAEEQTITPVCDEHGSITHFIIIRQDIEERKQNEQRLIYLASHDSLTALPNRHALEMALERAVARARRGTPSALLFLDLDSFKIVNDTLGHAAGDELLITLSRLLTKQLREGDLLARIGGDEFAVLLENTPPEQARYSAERLRESVHAFRFEAGERRFLLGLSIGVVPVEGHHTTQTLLAQADAAMYNAKEGGRNRVVIFQPGESRMTQLSEAHQWGTRIKDALWDDRFMLYFQPVVRLEDNTIAHYEALLRMEGETGELILPGVFIPAAERFGLMPAIDHWLVQHAIRTLHDHPGIHLFINLSGRSRGDEELLNSIELQLSEYGVAAARLGFEITETSAVQDLKEAEHWIRRLRALGCSFALDDFGVGFTSFAYLRSLPVDQIKIDGSFIVGIDQDVGNRAIVQAMHTLAQSMGKETVAEFVEDAATIVVLREIGITYGQGYYLGRPSPHLATAVLDPLVSASV